MVMRIKCALWRQVSHNYSEAHRSLCPSFSDRFTCKLCLLRVILIFSQVWVPDWCCILHVGPYNGYSWWKVCCSTFWQNWRYNRPKILFAFIHTPSICFDQDRSDVSNRPKYSESFQHLPKDGYNWRVIHPVLLEWDQHKLAFGKVEKHAVTIYGSCWLTQTKQSSLVGSPTDNLIVGGAHVKMPI